MVTHVCKIHEMNYQTLDNRSCCLYVVQQPTPYNILEAMGTLRAKKVKICLFNSKKIYYNMKCKWIPNFQTPFMDCDGWAKFALDHELEDGNVCVFELLSPGPLIILFVHIFIVVAKDSAKENSIHELCGGQRASLNQK